MKPTDCEINSRKRKRALTKTRVDGRKVLAWRNYLADQNFKDGEEREDEITELVGLGFLF